MALARYYYILGVNPEASFQEVKKAFRRQAFELHPDRNNAPDAHQRFVEIQEAYSILETYHRTGTRPITQAERHEEAQRRQQARDAQAQRRRKPGPHDFKRAREKRMQEKAEADKALYLKIFEEFSRSWRMTFAIIVAAIGLLLSVAIMADFILPYDAEMIIAQHGDYSEKEKTGFIFVDGFEQQVSAEIHYAVLTRQPITVFRSRIFHDVCKIRYVRQDVISESSPAGMINIAPLAAVVFLIPLIGFWYRKPDFTYTFFFVHYSLYVAPVLYLYFFVSGARVLKLFGWW